MREVPALEAHEGSWVVIRVATGETILEVFKGTRAADALRHLRPDFEAVPIGKHLASLNQHGENDQ